MAIANRNQGMVEGPETFRGLGGAKAITDNAPPSHGTITQRVSDIAIALSRLDDLAQRLLQRLALNDEIGIASGRDEVRNKPEPFTHIQYAINASEDRIARVETILGELLERL